MQKNQVKPEQPPFVVIPSEVLGDARLSPSEKLLFAQISNLANNPERRCWASNKYIAGLMDMSPERIRHMISNLTDCGFLRFVPVYKKDPQGRPTKELESRHLYPYHYLLNMPELPNFKELCGEQAPDSLPPANSSPPPAKNSRTPLRSNLAVPPAKNSRLYKRKKIEKENNITSKEQTARACVKSSLSKQAAVRDANFDKRQKAQNALVDFETGNDSDWITIQKGMSIDFTWPELVEYAHLESHTERLCRWLWNTQPGAQYHKKGLATLLVKFAKMRDRMEFAQDEAYALEPTKQEWAEWCEILRAGRGIRPMTYAQIKETLAGFVVPSSNGGL